MLDTNIFNAIKDGDIDIEAIFSGLPIFVTHVQLDEIRAALNEARRTQLEGVVRGIPHQGLQTPSGVWDVSKWGQGDGATAPCSGSPKSAWMNPTGTRPTTQRIS